MHFERFDLAAGDWSEQLANLGEVIVPQTAAWLRFLERTQHGEAVAALLRQDDEVIGAFTGMIVRKFGLRILGSPFPGWTTSYMGLALAADVSRNRATRALIEFAFGELDCIHVEMMDRHLTVEDLHGIRARYRLFRSWEVDLQEDDALLKSFSRSCRWKIRAAMKNGLVVEETTSPDFVDEYYGQLLDVFRRQRLAPTYDRERVAQLIATVGPTQQLLLLRARTDSGEPAATGIFHAVDDRTVYGWGFASWTHRQHLYPNELLMFRAMQWWRDRGYAVLDLAGAGDYKKRYHPRPIIVPWIRVSKYPIVGSLRELARASFRFRQRVLGRLAPGPSSVESENEVAVEDGASPAT
jgi:CelD/BcsL family acetyltransferase involved in cellulose biosynthesis